MKKSLKIVFCLIMLLNVIMVFPKSTFATNPDYSTMISNANGWDADPGVKKVTRTVMGTIIQVMRIVGVGVAIIMLTYVAIKYMSAAPAEKAEFKKSATAYIVGAIVLFGTSGILGIIENFASTNIKKTSTSSYVEMIDIDVNETYLG